MILKRKGKAMGAPSLAWIRKEVGIRYSVANICIYLLVRSIMKKNHVSILF